MDPHPTLSAAKGDLVSVRPIAPLGRQLIPALRGQFELDGQLKAGPIRGSPPDQITKLVGTLLHCGQRPVAHEITQEREDIDQRALPRPVRPHQHLPLAERDVRVAQTAVVEGLNTADHGRVGLLSQGGPDRGRRGLIVAAP